MSLEAALKEADAANAAGELVYQEIADKHGVNRSTLSRHHRGVIGVPERPGTPRDFRSPHVPHSPPKQRYRSIKKTSRSRNAHN
jgi:hypothetical protein